MEPERDEKKALQQLLTYYNYLRCNATRLAILVASEFFVFSTLLHV